jgi:hypothetical protein
MGNAAKHIAKAGRGQTAHQPEYDGGQLVVGVGDKLNQRDERRKDLRHNDAGEHQHDGGGGFVDGADGKTEQDGRKPEHKGKGVNGGGLAKEQNGQRRAKPRARTDAEHARADQGLRNKALKSRPPAARQPQPWRPKGRAGGVMSI